MNDIQIISFTTTQEAYTKASYEIRTMVFVEEQSVDPEEEYDEYEATSQHYLLLLKNEPVATARWRETTEGIKLERFAVLPAFRNMKLGEAILKKVLEETVPMKKVIYLHAQIRAVPFYQRHGFETTGEPFVEADITHMKMTFAS